MGKATGFLEFDRHDRGYEKPETRLKNWNEFVVPLDGKAIHDQAARCMNCGIPYCHNGCPDLSRAVRSRMHAQHR